MLILGIITVISRMNKRKDRKRERERRGEPRREVLIKKLHILRG